jgi:hypothetical protein
MFAPYNFILLLPALLVLVENWRVLWARGLISRAGFLLGVIAVAWPWVTAIGLGIASLILAPQTVERWWWLPLYTCAKIPMPIVCLIPLSILLIAMWQEHETRVLEAAPQAGMVA